MGAVIRQLAALIVVGTLTTSCISYTVASGNPQPEKIAELTLLEIGVAVGTSLMIGAIDGNPDTTAPYLPWTLVGVVLGDLMGLGILRIGPKH